MKRALVLSSILLGSVLLGCSGSTAGTDPTASATAAQTGTRVAAVAPQAKTTRVRLAADALSTIPLRDDQRTQIEQLASDAEARQTKSGASHSQILLALAAQVEAGQIDRAALQPKLDAAADAANADRPAEQAALVHLHDILTPDQRAQFVDAMESRAKAKHAEHPHKNRMETWAADLQLTDDQKTQIMAAIATLKSEAGEHEHGHDHDFKAMGHGKAFMESFKSDTLTLPAPKDAHEFTNKMADHITKVAQIVLPILTPQQRTLAAAKLREHAAAAATDDEAAGVP